MTKAGISIRQVSAKLLLAALLLYSTVGLSEVRVIVEYDSQGHRLVRVVELSAKRSAPVSDHLGAKTKSVITPANVKKKVKLLWFGADGELISTELMNDPRLTHAPLTNAELSPTVVGLDSGAFVVDGPSGSAVLEIHMPANPVVGLDQQFWRLMLVR